jgi:hypothetical protein
MKTTPILILTLGLLCGCYTATEKQKIVTAIDRGSPPGVIKPPITMKTQFAAKCPYCSTLNFSKSCMQSGSGMVPITITNATATFTTNVLIATWSIQYICPRCGMPHSDHRLQSVPDTTSVRLPVLDQ